jgi:uncharacterized protein with GYD domain
MEAHMATYLMLGKYSLEALKAISAERSDKATALIKRNGGELRAAYALLGDTDLAIIVDLPDNGRAIKTSVELSKMLGISFSTVPAVTVEEFDKLVG